MKSRMLMGLVGLAVSVMFVSAVTAAEKSTAAMSAPPVAEQHMKLESFNGVIENVNAANKDVLVQYHKDKMTFVVGDHTKIFEGKKELNLSALNKGQWASVKYDRNGSQLVAESIHVSPLKEAKNMTSSAKMMTGTQMMAPTKTTEKK
jgi:Cu/Ag efflux protein CusF